MNKVSVVGTGYVGLVTGTCLAEIGNDVIGVDIDENKINNLRNSISPIFEPGIEELLKRNINQGRLRFTTDIKYAVENSSIIFIAVGTPPLPTGDADLSYVKSVSELVGKYMNGYKIVVNKSTVPIGMGDIVTKIIMENQSESFDFEVVSNPEFLKEGSAINDFFFPDRIIIGTRTEGAAQTMINLYRPLKSPIIVTDVRSAEMIKYASNAFLATKISFINEIAALCEKVGADIELVSHGMGMDKRINPMFLKAGAGFGGSCFPKDISALIKIGEQNNINLGIVKSAQEANFKQRKMVFSKIKNLCNPLENKTIGILGVSFKPNTDDIREAPSIDITRWFLSEGCKVRIYDPVANDEFRKIFNNSIEYAKNPVELARDVDLLLLLTEWNEFKELNFTELKSVVRSPYFFDARNTYDPNHVQSKGFIYDSIGRGSGIPHSTIIDNY
ncbi:MAG: UDP-glucose/GDP-mannose dehydrogenase family protein [Candidatus Coatesbacteria bacterium]|nr:UDP-glucose/GDP-mannose dehydrogenase family protein [Candidatus Coatesbacteria bacterium]